MTQGDFLQIKDVYITRLRNTSLLFKRYIHKKINWDARLIGIKGARGVGKTTLLMQHIKTTFKNPDDAFYVSLDSYWFQSHNLVELVQWLYGRGVRHIYLDEVHKYPMWSQIVKDLYDTYSDLYIVYTGSSMLEIDNSKVDLSRRQTLYSMAGMSFREYVNRLRITYAKQLMAENPELSKSQIATMCGYNTPSSFYRNWKKYEEP